MKDLEYVVYFSASCCAIFTAGRRMPWSPSSSSTCAGSFTPALETPREFNWVVGVCLLLLTLFLSFTGYLLPWDQLASWAVTVGSNIASYMPVIGSQVCAT